MPDPSNGGTDPEGKPHKKTQDERLKEKRQKLEDIVTLVAKRLKLTKESLRTQVVGDRITISGQFRLLRKSERLQGIPNSEEEIEPSKAVQRHRRKKQARAK